MMTYEEALTYYDKAALAGSILQRDVMDALLQEIGNPHLDLKYIHIAGTNGKGSCSAFTSSILNKAGYRTGLYVSPFIQEFGERVQVSGELIPKEAVASITEELVNASKVIMERGFRQPTVFELITAMGFLWFKRQNCDIVVLEVGMGGRLDATNSIPEAEVYTIMNIGYDHIGELGDTLELIAGEKAGIIKEAGGPVVVYEQGENVLDVFRSVCAEKGKDMVVAESSSAVVKSIDIDGTVIDYKDYKDLRISLLGNYQVRNAITVINVVEQLIARGWNITEQNIRDGLASAHWPGRVEVLRRDPVVIVDGAHNPQGTTALAETLRSIFPDRKFTFVCGVLADKDYDSSLDVIAPLADKFYAVTPNSYRALSAEQLAKEITTRCNVPAKSYDTIPEALDDVMANATKDDIICVFGSLYQVGEIRSYYGFNTF